MEWDCKNVEIYTQAYNGNEGVIWNVHWKVKKSEEDDNGTYTGSSYGSISLNTETIENFVPVSEVTSDLVQSWVISAMGEDAVTSLEALLDSQIEEQKNPSTTLITIQE